MLLPLSLPGEPGSPARLAELAAELPRPTARRSRSPLREPWRSGAAWWLSGGALGSDAAAHRGALAARGLTCDPAGLFPEIAERGCLLSSFAPGSPPQRWQFPARNALLTALADLVVLVEAGADSGSLTAAEHARRQRRPVAAFPGSAGAATALAKGAQPVHSVADVLALLSPGPGDHGRGALREGKAHA